MTKRIVIVEDDFLIATYLANCCRTYGFNVVGEVRTADAAVSAIRETKPDFVLMDVRLPGDRDGIEVAVQVREELPDVKVVFVTGSSDHSSIARINSAEPHGILFKPIFPEGLRDLLT